MWFPRPSSLCFALLQTYLIYDLVDLMRLREFYFITLQVSNVYFEVVLETALVLNAKAGYL